MAKLVCHRMAGLGQGTTGCWFIGQTGYAIIRDTEAIIANKAKQSATWTIRNIIDSPELVTLLHKYGLWDFQFKTRREGIEALEQIFLSEGLSF